jgi:hypothetical protein
MMNENISSSAVVRCVADIETANAVRYLTQICKHFQHKIPVELSGASGHIAFSIGTCSLRADAERLTLLLDAADEAQLLQLQDVVARHLLRFAFREELQVVWRGASVGEGG